MSFDELKEKLRLEAKREAAERAKREQEALDRSSSADSDGAGEVKREEGDGGDKPAAAAAKAADTPPTPWKKVSHRASYESPPHDAPSRARRRIASLSPCTERHTSHHNMTRRRAHGGGSPPPQSITERRSPSREQLRASLGKNNAHLPFNINLGLRDFGIRNRGLERRLKACRRLLRAACVCVLCGCVPVRPAVGGDAAESQWEQRPVRNARAVRTVGAAGV